MAARRVLKAVLVDLNGTLHIEDSAVPGAQEALKRQATFFFISSDRFCQRKGASLNGPEAPAFLRCCR